MKKVLQLQTQIAFLHHSMRLKSVEIVWVFLHLI